MTLGEKIKFYRESLGITQTQLSEMSKIGISTIKKLECDMMNPKPNMLKKVADALHVSMYIFTDFDIDGVSDVLALLTKMDEQIDMTFEAEYDENQDPIPETIKISFKPSAINSKLADYIKARNLQNNVDKDRGKYTESAETAVVEHIEDVLEKSRLTICRDGRLVSKKYSDGNNHVKL